MDLINYIGIMLGSILGLLLIPGSFCALSYDPANPDWTGFLVTMGIGILSLGLAYFFYRCEFNEE
jgi:hypothetical protein